MTYKGNYSINFCCYDSTWNDEPNDEWYDGRLRGVVKENVKHGGAISGAQLEAVVTRDMNTKMIGTGKDEWATVEDYQKQQVKGVQSDASFRVKALSVAKPFGKLSTGAAPCAIPIILPVFSDVALVPSSMYPNNNLSSNQSIYFELFLIWLSENGANLDNIFSNETADSLKAFAGEDYAQLYPYLQALQKLANTDPDDSRYNYTITEEVDGDTVTRNLTFREYASYWYQSHFCPNPTSTTSWGPSL